ncbi:MAG: hypothetical protein DME57_10420 [Verrucomicrobia bacterium]|nr:MAG: hypothetical protein DME57_10420 [Verrucomicrobiota bacterium]
MNSQRTGLRVASVIFGLVTIAHILRVFKHAKINVASHVIPLEVSWIGIIVFGVLCIWMWRLSAGR